MDDGASELASRPAAAPPAVAPTVAPTAAPTPLVSATGLRRQYDGGRIPALNGADLQLAAGEFVALMGPSGCGKSTLLQLIGALERPDAGQLRYRGQPYEHMADLARFRALYVGFVFQSFHLLPTLTALENVQLPMLEGRHRPRHRRERAAGLLDAMGLSHRAGHRPGQLSGGERQRVAIARALANDPPLLLADEPTGSLDSDGARQILELLRGLHRERRLTILMVTHDAAVASAAGRVLRMLDGRIVAQSGACA